MKKTLLFLCAVIFVLNMTACSVFKNFGEARALADTYFKAIKEKDFESAVSYYSPQFFEDISRTEAIEVLAGKNTSLGDLVSYKFIGSHVVMEGGPDGSNATYSLSYKTIYSKGSATETLTIIKSEDGTKMEILSFNIDSPNLVTY